MNRMTRTSGNFTNRLDEGRKKSNNIRKEDIATPQRLTSLELLLPQQSAMDAATSRNRGLPLHQQLATRTPQRRAKFGLPLPQQLATGTPKRRQKPHTKKLNPSERSGPAISYTVHTTRHHKVLDQSAGPTKDGWREGVEKLASSIVFPANRRSPTIRRSRSAATKCPADAWRLMQGTKSQRFQNSYRIVQPLPRQSAPMTPQRRPHSLPQQPRQDKR